MISSDACVAFLRRIHLFHGLSDEDLAIVAAVLHEESHSKGERVFSEGDEAEQLFFILRGSVCLTYFKRGQEQEAANLVEGDYFGEEALLSGRFRSADASAMEQVDLLSMRWEDFKALREQFPKLRKALEVSAASRRLARKVRFDWLNKGEIVYFLARKHEVLLIQGLSLPMVALAVPIVLLAYFLATRAFFAIFGAGFLLVLILGWAVWNWIDWGNDFYIVTNQRAVWVEKVIGLYDSRQEAPLSMVLSVGVETDMTGRILDYGNLIVRTYVGKIVFSHVAHPHEAAHLVEEHWTRIKRSASRLEREAMRNALRRKMGLPVEMNTEEAAKTEPMVTPTIYHRSVFKVIGANWFKLRFEDSGTITYRKHWFVLIKQVWQPTVLILLIGIGMVARLVTLVRTPGQRLIDLSKVPPIDTTMLALPALMIPVILWWIYQYIDWRNDVYMVTPDQILDIDKKPFGTEERRSAPLENILSTESERIGLTGYLFNYGTVYITIGGANLDFQDVLDPTSVQADIDRRRETRVAMKREMEAAAERERMSDWLLAYHENEAENRKSSTTNQPRSKSE